MNTLQPKDAQLLLDNEDEFCNKIYKSIYSTLNSKLDNITRVFSNEVIIEKEDLNWLNEKVFEKLRSLNIESMISIKITITYSNKKTAEFMSWEVFLQQENIRASAINNIIMTWDFAMEMKNYALPQRHILTVKLSDGMRPEEMLNLIFTGNIKDLNEADISNDYFPVVARVEYINSLIAEELLNIVAQWYRHLKKAQECQSKIVHTLKKHKRKVSYFINYGIVIFVVILGYAVLDNFFSEINILYIAELTTNQLQSIVYRILGLVILFNITNKFFSNIANNLYGQLNEYGETHIFNITSGDKERQKSLERFNNKKKGQIILKVVGNIVLDIICGLISSVLLK